MESAFALTANHQGFFNGIGPLETFGEGHINCAVGS
jgi:hypothetical protein